MAQELLCTGESVKGHLMTSAPNRLSRHRIIFCLHESKIIIRSIMVCLRIVTTRREAALYSGFNQNRVAGDRPDYFLFILSNSPERSFQISKH